MCATEVNYKLITYGSFYAIQVLLGAIYHISCVLYNTCCSYISIVWFYYIATRFLHHLLSPLSAKEPEVLYDVSVWL